MAGMESNLNSAELVDQSPEVRNENEATREIVNANEKDVQAAVESLSNKSPMEHFGLKTETAKNVITKICGKEDINQITMKDILSLHPLKKSQLAWEISALRPLDKTKSLHKVNFAELRKKLKTGINMTIDNLNKEMKVNLGQKEWSQILREIRKDHNELARKEYFKMFKPGDIIPPMQEISTLATGDLSGTAGIGGGRNKGREYFDYDLNSPNTMERSVVFGPVNGNAEIGISATGINLIDGKGGGSFDMSFGNLGVIHGDYTADGLVVDTNRLPTGITWNNGVLTIPKQYKNTPITITTKSNRHPQGGYDEVMFNFSCKNASLENGFVAAPANDVEGSRDFGLGEYMSSQKEQNDFGRGINAITKATSNSFAENIPVTLGVTIDKTKFNPSKIDGFMEKTKDFGFDAVMDNYQNRDNDKDQLKVLSTKIFNEFRSKINVSNFQGEKEQKAQQRLAECRFWEAMGLALKKREFRKQLLSGKIHIESQFAVGTERKITTSIEEQDLIAVKR